MKFQYKLGIIGFGNMATSILNGCISANFLSKNDVLVHETDKNKCIDYHVAKNIEEIYKKCQYILLSVKPQNAIDVLKNMPYNNNVIISIMAGFSMCNIQKFLSDNAKIVRCMPNTPCLIGEGMTAISYLNVNEDDKFFVKNIFSSCGSIAEVQESDLHAVTSISGSGPAYFYMLIKSIIESGISHGLSYDLAKQLASQTAIGASKMILNSSEDISHLIDKVCSKGGTTIEAVTYFAENNFDNTVKNALQKCFDKSKELSK